MIIVPSHALVNCDESCAWCAKGELIDLHAWGRCTIFPMFSTLNYLLFAVSPSPHMQNCRTHKHFRFADDPSTCEYDNWVIRTVSQIIKIIFNKCERRLGTLSECHDINMVYWIAWSHDGSDINCQLDCTLDSMRQRRATSDGRRQESRLGAIMPFVPRSMPLFTHCAWLYTNYSDP